MILTSQELARYNRHLKLPGFGLEGQLKLKQSSVLLIGAGGLGCPIGMYLAGAGVGRIGVVDFDVIEVSNLQRQISHKTDDEGLPKADSLVQAMEALNPKVEYFSYRRKLDASWVSSLVQEYDLVIDGTDNYTTRYLVADACFFEKKPLVYGAIHQFDAQISLFNPAKGSCYRCLFPVPPDPSATPSCSEAGVLGVLPGVVGVMMACEAIKFLSGLKTLEGSLALYSAIDQSIRHIRLNRDPNCPLCGESPTIKSVVEEVFVCDNEPLAPEITVEYAQELINNGATVLDVRDEHEWLTNRLPSAAHIPLSQLTLDRACEFSREAPLVVYCYKGSRSKKAVTLLKDWGFDQAVSMAGGIDQWCKTVDPSMVRY